MAVHLLAVVAACLAINAPVDALGGQLQGFLPTDVAVGVIDLGCMLATRTFTPSAILNVIGDGANVAVDFKKHRGR